MLDQNYSVLEEETMEQRPEDQESDAKSERPAIERPDTTDSDWEAKIRRAREAWKAGRRLRKDQPAAPISLLDL